MSINLQSVNAKLVRAKDRSAAIHETMRTYMQGNPFELKFEKSADFSVHRCVVKFVVHPPLDLLTVLFSEFVHHARTALDSLVYAIAEHEASGCSVSPATTKKLMFIIKNSEQDFRAAYYHIGMLSDPVKSAIKSVQPFLRPHGGGMPPLLAVLRDFNDVDKHRMVQPALATVYEGESNFKHPGMTSCVVHDHVGPVIDGTVLRSISVEPPSAQFRHEYRGSLIVSLPHAVGPNGGGVSCVASLVDLLLKEVEDVIAIVRSSVL